MRKLRDIEKEENLLIVKMCLLVIDKYWQMILSKIIFGNKYI